MAEPLEIKHMEPSLRRMAADYHLMFSGFNLKFTLILCTLIAVLLVGWFVTPSTLDPSANIVLRVLAFIDAYFLVGLGGMLVLRLASPLLVRFIFPFVITLLEIVRLLIWSVQFMIDRVLIESFISSFFYPEADDDTPQ